MRFNEFNILSEESSSGFVAVGDSHAAAVAVAGRSAWTNLAVVGASSSGSNSLTSRMRSNISRIPKGSVVLISLGGNDTANSLSRPTPVSPDSIASNVAAVVDRVKSKEPSKIIFMLFPVGPGRGGRNRDEEATRKSLEYQRQVRDAIKAKVAIGGVDVIDINGAPLTDGVHATMSTYAGVARRVMGMGTPTVSDTPARNGSGELPVGGGLRSGPPYPESDEDAVRKMQQTLIRLGYSVGKSGDDGKYGIRTQNAVRAFKKDNNIPGDGLSMSASDLEKLKTAKKVDRPTPTGNDTRGRNRSRGATLEPLAQDSVTQGKVGAVLDLIARPESGGRYDAVYPGRRRPEILDMTISELIQDMRARGRATGSSASGRYQYIRTTLQDLVSSMGIDPNRTKFDKETQDRIAIYHLRKDHGLDRWLAGRMSNEQFLDRLSKTWAGLPNPGSGGSYYSGVLDNRAGMNVRTALTSLNQIQGVA